jgi:hypothetical protein
MKLQILLLAFALIAGPALADTANVQLSPPTTRTDGAPLAASEIATYTFYRSASPTGPFDTVVGVVAEPVREITVTLESAEFYVAFTTTDVDGRVGPLSAYATIPAEIAPPGAGVIDSVTITITLP